MSHDTQIIVLASQKGGSGKTTISGHLAVQAELAGAGPVALIDTDPQGSLAQWWNARASATPAFAQTTVADLKQDIEVLKKSGYRLIVIDTPPAVTSTISEVITHADLVVIPIRPSPHDLRAVGPTVDIIEYQQKQLVFVVNSATMRARITGETAVALSQHGMVAPVTLHHRVDFAASMIDGRTVGEINPKSRSATEVSKLWAYLDTRLVKLRGGTEMLMNPSRHGFEIDLLTPLHESQLQERPLSDRSDDMALAADFPAPPQMDERPSADGALLLNKIPPAPTPAPHEMEPEIEAAMVWDNTERRTIDRGPPPGVLERRNIHRVFGRRDGCRN